MAEKIANWREKVPATARVTVYDDECQAYTARIVDHDLPADSTREVSTRAERKARKMMEETD